MCVLLCVSVPACLRDYIYIYMCVCVCVCVYIKIDKTFLSVQISTLHRTSLLDKHLDMK